MDTRETTAQTTHLTRLGRALSLTRVGRVPWALPATLSVMVIGVLSTFVVSTLVARDVTRSELRAFDRKLQGAAGVVERQLDDFQDVLHAMRAHVNAQPELSFTGFRTFVGWAIERIPAVSLLEWAPLVLHADRSAVESAMREEGLDGFTIREPGADGALLPAQERAWYVPLAYIVPESPDAVGFDLASEPGRRGQLEEAALRDAPLASGRFRLIEDEPGQYAIALYLAVRERPEGGSLRGYVIAVLRLEALLDRILEAVPLSDSAHLRLEDRTDVPAVTLHGRGIRPSEGARVLSSSAPLAFAGRDWVLVAESTAPAAVPREAGTVALFGLLLTLLFALGVLATARVRGLQQQVDEARQLGQYTLEIPLGSGGMGTVYRARHALLQRPTAVKVLKGDPGSSSMVRFEREVQVTAMLRHPNTVRVHDYGRTEDGQVYYAMELLDGITLHDLVALQGPLLPGRVIHLLRQCCGSLAEAHDIGLLHRDVKPENIMVLRMGRVADFVKVLDFGLVREVNAPPDMRVTNAETILGTPHYMAPETIRGDRIDPRSDLYSLGCVAYFLLCGHRVFKGSSAVQACMAHLTEAPRPPSERGRNLVIPASLERLVMQLLSKDPEDRPASASELRELLGALEGVGAWTEEDALSWWEENLPDAGVSRPVPSVLGSSLIPTNRS
ncbi:MAG: hypothetical protein EA398_09020 [Deltaproteobacteria bacterium]|nr:MAG: hypothetical protein EA398_09020 [Deltaproteobacteria bacterium]